ncbi:MAG: N-acetyltransferase [Desulfovibrio sp.]|nr:N-acetyltransferase [Desulfovibrio sp.]
MHIRDEQPDDFSTISKIHYAAFKDHPVHPSGSEPVEHIIVDRLRASDCLTLSLVAEEGGEVVGHIAISPAVVGEDKTGWYLLGPVGVKPGLQGKGFGSALVSEALSRMRALGAAGVVLVGDPGFYTRFGFENVKGLGYPGVPDQYVLAAIFGGAAPKGDITAHEAFSITAQ